MENKLIISTPCGLECFKYNLYEMNFTNMEAKSIQNNYSISKDEVVCKGCSFLIHGIHSGSLQCCNSKTSDVFCRALENDNYQNIQEMAI